MEELKLYYSKEYYLSKAILMFVFGFMPLVFIIIVGENLQDGTLKSIVNSLAFIYLAFWIIYIFRNLGKVFKKDIAFILDEKYFYDNFSPFKFGDVLWKDVVSINTEEFNGEDHYYITHIFIKNAEYYSDIALIRKKIKDYNPKDIISFKVHMNDIKSKDGYILEKYFNRIKAKSFSRKNNI